MRSLSLLIALCVSSLAHADVPKQPDAAAQFRAGVEAFQNKSYDEAREHFAKAYDIEPMPDLLWSWAQAERFAGNCVTAIGLYKKYEREAQTPSKASAARDMIGECEKQLPPKRPAWYTSVLGDSLTAGGIVGIATGVTFLSLASSSRDAANQQMYLDDFAAKLDEATVRRRIGAISLTVGAAAVAAGITVYVIRGRHNREVAVGTDGRVVSFGGRF